MSRAITDRDKAVIDLAEAYAAGGLNVAPGVWVPKPRGGFTMGHNRIKTGEEDTKPHFEAVAAERAICGIWCWLLWGARPLVAVDVDRKNGHDGPAWLASHHLGLPGPYQHTKTEGDRHHLFYCPGGLDMSDADLGDGVELKTLWIKLFSWEEPTWDGAWSWVGLTVEDVSAFHPLPEWVIDGAKRRLQASPPAPAKVYDGAGDGRPWALRLLDDRIAAFLAAAGPGHRSLAYNGLCYLVGRVTGGGGLDAEYAYEALFEAGVEAGADVEAILPRAWADGLAYPFAPTRTLPARWARSVATPGRRSERDRS